MSEPSYWALFTDKMAIFRFLNLHLLRGFLVQSSLKSFSLLQMFNRLNSGKRKGGKGGGYWGEMERDPVVPFPSPPPPLYAPVTQATSPPNIFSGAFPDIQFKPTHMLCTDYFGNFQKRLGGTSLSFHTMLFHQKISIISDLQ